MTVALDLELLTTLADLPEPQQDLAACLNVRGSYSPMQFILRLNPRIHSLVNQYTDNSAPQSDVPWEAIQAYSTYLHETVHWWQHVGSTSGLVMSLSYPGQLHTSMGELRSVIRAVGPKKSLKDWAEDILRSGDQTFDGIIDEANIAVNNALDVEFYKIIAFDPNKEEIVYKDPYFESAGHCFHIAYQHTLSVAGTTCDPEFEHLPDPRSWMGAFAKLAEQKVTGYYYGSPILHPPVGVKAIFEGQARFAQMQYLSFASGPDGLDYQHFVDEGYLDGIYGEAFSKFLEITRIAPPRLAHDSTVALFLLVCDLAINPTRGFPLPILNFDKFLPDVSPGIRFASLCHAVHSEPALANAITRFSRDEYFHVAGKLAKAAGYDHPLDALRATADWQQSAPEVATLMQEHSTFEFRYENLPIRVLLSHHIAFCVDKLERPEVFCWPGAALAGPNLSEDSQRLWLKHLSLYSDKEDDNCVFARQFPDKKPEAILATYNAFFGGILIYDLTHQWILEKGPFRYNYDWLTTSYSVDMIAESAKRTFERILGANPDAFDILDPGVPPPA